MENCAVSGIGIYPGTKVYALFIAEPLCWADSEWTPVSPLFRGTVTESREVTTENRQADMIWNFLTWMRENAILRTLAERNENSVSSETLTWADLARLALHESLFLSTGVEQKEARVTRILVRRDVFRPKAIGKRKALIEKALEVAASGSRAGGAFGHVFPFCYDSSSDAILEQIKGVDPAFWPCYTGVEDLREVVDLRPTIRFSTRQTEGFMVARRMERWAKVARGPK